MTYKSLPAGDLIRYVQSSKDYKAKERDQLPEWIGPLPQLTQDFLRCASPPHVQSDRRRRWVRHCGQHLTHLIIGFSEDSKAGATYRPIAIRTLEQLVAAGMPLDSLQFVWCEHRLPENFHLHGGLVRSILPAGGAYEPALLGGLAVDCSWLVSRRLGLSLPTGFARLVRGGEFSYKPAHQDRLDKICSETLARFKSNLLPDHTTFLELLKELGETVLVSPGPSGLPCLRKIQPFNRLYRQSVAVEDGSGSVIWLAGLACRHRFTAQNADKELGRHWDKFKSEGAVFARLQKAVQERIDGQQERYPFSTDQQKVALKVFDWLDPDRDELRFLALGSMEASKCRQGADDFELPNPTKIPAASDPPRDILDPSAPSMPEAGYPYYSDLTSEKHDITAPDILFADDLDEPLKEDVWELFALNPRGSDQGEHSLEPPLIGSTPAANEIDTDVPVTTASMVVSVAEEHPGVTEESSSASDQA